MKDNIDDLIQEISREDFQGATRFAIPFANFVSSIKHDVVVETGEGVSSLWLLKTCPGIQKLCSIDINPWFKHNIIHPNHKQCRGPSTEYLPKLLKELGQWDVFLHDSDHEVECQSYELEFAFWAVRGGGYIACDDFSWSTHGAWEKFISRHHLSYNTIGSVAITQRPPWKTIDCSDHEKIHDVCLRMAKQAEIEWKKTKK